MGRPPATESSFTDGVVTLRASEPRDLPAINAGIHDPDVIRWIGPPEGSAIEVLALNRQRWERGSPTMSICEDDGACVGLVWLNRHEADPATGSVGYWLLPNARGRGLATRAVRLLSAWAGSGLGVTRLRLSTAPDNERSRRLAERTGFREVRPPDDDGVGGRGVEPVVYERGADVGGEEQHVASPELRQGETS